MVRQFMPSLFDDVTAVKKSHPDPIVVEMATIWKQRSTVAFAPGIS